jgi:predicted lipid-binding transport protein (Tim44 family)
MMRVRNGAIGALALLLIAALIAGFIANENRKQAIESRNQAVQMQMKPSDRKTLQLLKKTVRTKPGLML